jgi:amidohydrolase
MMTKELSTMGYRAEKLAATMAKWRRHLHQHPELSFREYDTSQLVANTLKSLPGMHVETTSSGYQTAVVGTLSSGLGPTLAIRADMDALPIAQEPTHPFRSKHQGVMHACGHDAHTSMLLGVAHLLTESFQKGELEGSVKFLFQPAEECADETGMSGARYMIKAGVLDDVDGVIALHVDPEYPVGNFRVNTGCSMANVDVFEATLTGSGGHGAYPHLASDPTWMLGLVLQAIHGIVSRKVTPLEPAVISIGQIHAGSASNVIPSEVYIQGTLRSYQPAIRKQLVAELETAISLVKALGGDYTLQVYSGEPSLKNDASMNQWIVDSIHDLYPDGIVHDGPFGLGGEDFSYMCEKVPGAMFFLGAGLTDGIKRDLHTPAFDIDERCLPVGAAILAETARHFLKPSKR